MLGKYTFKCLILLLGSLIICSNIKADDIVWARYGDIDSLDPHKATSTLSLQVWSLIYDTMLATDKDGNIVPHVAKSWSSSSDGKVYTFELNDGIRFKNLQLKTDSMEVILTKLIDKNITPCEKK